MVGRGIEMRVLIAGILAGIIFFIWGAVAHMALPLGEMGTRAPQDEDAVLAAMTTALGSEGGIYFLPYIDSAGMKDAAKTAAFAAKSAANPYAYVVWQPQPTGKSPMDMGPQLTKQAITDLLLGVLLAWVLSLVAGGLGQRTGVAAVTGILVSLASHVPYWNWYRYPSDWLTGQAVEVVVGFTLAGAVAAWWLGRSRA